MSSHVLDSLLRPRGITVLYKLNDTVFKISGIFREVVFYDELEPEADARVILATPLDEFDIEVNTILEIKEDG